MQRHNLTTVLSVLSDFNLQCLSDFRPCGATARWSSDHAYFVLCLCVCALGLSSNTGFAWPAGTVSKSKTFVTSFASPALDIAHMQAVLRQPALTICLPDSVWQRIGVPPLFYKYGIPIGRR